MSKITDQQKIKALEERVATLEYEMLLCLKFMRFQAEKEAEANDLKITSHDTLKA